MKTVQAAAGALLEREEKVLPAEQEDPRLAALSALLAAYRAEKDRRGLWDRYNLFAGALGRLREKPLAAPAVICANVTGEEGVRTFLEALNANLLPVPCAWQAPRSRRCSCPRQRKPPPPERPGSPPPPGTGRSTPRPCPRAPSWTGPAPTSWV